MFRLQLGAGERQLTLKARVDDCARVNASLLRAAKGKCEIDVHGDNMQPAVSLEADFDETTVQGLLERRVGLASTLSPAQKGYLESIRAWPLAKDLRPLGPTRVDTHLPAKGKFMAELWQAPGGGRWAEISRRTETVDAAGVRKAMLEDLSKARLEPCADQSSAAGAKLRALLAAPEPTPGIR